MGIMEIIEEFKKPCACGMVHETAIRDVRIGSGIVHETGSILKGNGFCKELLLVADEHTIKAADGVLESLDKAGFSVEKLIYEDLRVAEMSHVDEIEKRLLEKERDVISVGSGSLNDPCRLASARAGRKFAICATAPSMDGFASYSSPIVADGFKASYPAKSPEVIIGDTKILAKAPAYLKAAGFGDMVAKYVGLVDWQISSLLTDEVYCPRVGDLTRSAVDQLMKMADRVTLEDEETAGQIFESLLMTGLGMSFVKNSRPASGSEHIIAHLLECKELPFGIIPNFHGEDVGVATLYTLRHYRDLASHEKIRAYADQTDWQDVYAFYGEMEGDVRKLNEPETITDAVDPKQLEAVWPKIRELIYSVPGPEECEDAMRRAGCKLTVSDIGKDEDLFRACAKYSPYMRKRLTLLRLESMFEVC